VFFKFVSLFLETIQSRRHEGGFGELSPPKQSSKPPQIEIWTL